VDAFSRGLESGNVAFNNPDAGVINAPYGGYKQSGSGYEHGPEGLEHYLRAKHVRVRYFNRK
jgi:succinate-semialdehyde dehydrogenase/glutarate-semialdehyde dehydrogenase